MTMTVSIEPDRFLGQLATSHPVADVIPGITVQMISTAMTPDGRDVDRLVCFCCSEPDGLPLHLRLLFPRESERPLPGSGC